MGLNGLFSYIKTGDKDSCSHNVKKINQWCSKYLPFDVECLIPECGGKGTTLPSYPQFTPSFFFSRGKNELALLGIWICLMPAEALTPVNPHIRV